MSDTPKTDALCRRHLDSNLYAPDALRDLRLHGEALERENAALRMALHQAVGDNEAARTEPANDGPSDCGSDALDRIADQLRKAGATLPAPQGEGTVESAMLTGLCIALCLVESERGSREGHTNRDSETSALDETKLLLSWALGEMGRPVRRIRNQNETYYDTYSRALEAIGHTPLPGASHARGGAQGAECNCPIPTHLHDVGCPRFDPAVGNATVPPQPGGTV